MTTAPKYEVEFDAIPGIRYPIADLDDKFIEAEAIRLRLWTAGQPFPAFSFYQDGEEAGGGGDGFFSPYSDPIR